jgi:CheY-like chemotaxis protein
VDEDEKMIETRNKAILLVEDEALIAMSEIGQLKNAGYRPVWAVSGERALEIVRSNQEPVDLVLMDINLGGGMDGTEAAREILAANDVPVVFLSSHLEEEIVRKTEEITRLSRWPSSCSTPIAASARRRWR